QCDAASHLGLEESWKTILGHGPHQAEAAGNPEWFTPAPFLDAARAALGRIDLDPASSRKAQRTVKAAAYYAKRTDGLPKPWSGRGWLNPPYSRPLIEQFCDKLAGHYERGDVTAAIALVNNATDARWFKGLAAVASVIGFTFERVKFLRPDGE